MKIPPYFIPFVGLSSGLLAGLFGTGGPPLIFYYQLKGTEKSTFRSLLMAIFLSMTVVRLPSYVYAGLITTPRLLATLVILPAVGIGAYLGNRIHIELAEATFRRLVGILLACIGFVLLIRYLTS